MAWMMARDESARKPASLLLLQIPSACVPNYTQPLPRLLPTAHGNSGISFDRGGGVFDSRARLA
jgi:hypothetical protein